VLLRKEDEEQKEILAECVECVDSLPHNDELQRKIHKYLLTIRSQTSLPSESGAILLKS